MFSQIGELKMELTAQQQEKINNKECLIFTDLDGTLLGHDAYDLGRVPEFLQHLKEINVPVIFNTSKTWAEVQELQKTLDYYFPCVVENGGGIHISAQSNWKPKALSDGENQSKIDENQKSVRDDINLIIDVIGSQFQFQRMRDWDAEQVSYHTSLSLENAMLANRRLYSEPLLWQDTDTNLVQFTQLVTEKGLRLVRGGRFCHVMKQHDKSVAMRKIISAYENDFGFKPLTIALGDNHNDKQMLENADIACVLTLSGRNRMEITHTSVYCPEQPAPEGWTESISFLFNF